MKQIIKLGTRTGIQSGKKLGNILKKTLASLSLSLAMAACPVLAIHAEPADKPVIYDSGNGYTAQKISHPKTGVMQPDGVVDYTGNGTLAANLENGNGDRGQNYSWGSIGYGDYIYIGTCYGAWTTTLQFMKMNLGHNYDDEVMQKALDTYYHGHMYTGEEDGVDALGILLKLNVKTGDVKILMSKELTNQNTIFRNAVVFKDKLYFCGAVNTIPCIYQVDPKTDECKQVYAGMTLDEYMAAYKQGLSVGIRGMCVYEDKLIVSCINTKGAVICESDNPTDQDSFQVIATDKELFGYPAYHYNDSIYGGSIFDMTQYGKSLYVSICTGTPKNAPDKNTMQSFALVRGDLQEDGTWKWASVAGDMKKDGAKYTFGIDPERTRSGAANLIAFDGYLYIGEYNDEEIAVERMLFDNDFTFMNLNFEQSINLYRMDQDENIELVVGDADKMFPQGSISGLSSGFGNKENQYVWKMAVHDGKLYVGTYDASSFLLPLDEYMNDENVSDKWKKKVDKYVAKLTGKKGAVPDSAYTCAEYLDQAVFGFDLYVTDDGAHFTKITDNGFGDPYNHGCRAFGITDDGLYVGTANPFYGTQVWKLTAEETATAQNKPNGNSSESNASESNTVSDASQNTVLDTGSDTQSDAKADAKADIGAQSSDSGQSAIPFVGAAVLTAIIVFILYKKRNVHK